MSITSSPSPAINQDSLPPFLRRLLESGAVAMADVTPLVRSARLSLTELEMMLIEKVGKERLLQEVSQDAGFPPFDLDQVKLGQAELQRTPEAMIRALNVVCVGAGRDGMMLAMVDPQDGEAVRKVEARSGEKVAKRVLALRSDMAVLRAAIGGEAPGADRALQVFERILSMGMEGGASDIHIEPTEDSVRVRFRRQGMLSDGFDVRTLAGSRVAANQFKTSLPVVVKNRATNLDMTETHKPQDGRINLPGQSMDMRVSVLPSAHGESIVIRLHTGALQVAELSSLGFSSSDLRRMQSIVQAPYGLILVSGPTGSGKTTTLYSLVRRLNDPIRKILTIEDPIEYMLPGVVQCQTNTAKGFGFSEALRSFLRHDPDVIVVGEIRDAEAAHLAVEAACTGHLVLSCVHANDSVRTVTRLRDLRVTPLLITSTCLATIAQRLVRVVCRNCKEVTRFSRRLYNMFDRYDVPFRECDLVSGKGCEQCNYSGFEGRIGVYEVLCMTPTIRDMIVRDCMDEQIRQAARAEGTRTLLEEALHRVAQGVTTEADVWRVAVDEAE